jgi:chromosome partitioning protein
VSTAIGGRPGWLVRAREKLSTDRRWVRERANPQTEAGYPQVAPVSRETQQDDGTVHQVESAAVGAIRHTGVRTAGELAEDRARFDGSTPMARAVEQQILVRQGRRPGTALPRPDRTRVMVVANQKGGVGKTTTAVNLAVALAQHDLRVLVIDLDPQGNASTALAVDHHRGTLSSYDVLVDGTPLVDVVQPHPDIARLSVAPATIDLAGAEIELVSVVARESRLRKAIAAHPLVDGGGEERFDYVLIDCPPSLGLLTLNALVAGAEMLIPIQAEYYALEGLGQLLETVEMVRTHLNENLVVSTILLTMYDSRTNLAAGVAAEVRAHFRDQVLKTAIPRSVRVSEAPSYAQSVMTYDPGSPGALSYLEAAREMALRGVRPPADAAEAADHLADTATGTDLGGTR